MFKFLKDKKANAAKVEVKPIPDARCEKLTKDMPDMPKKTFADIKDPPVHIKDRNEHKCSDFIKAVTSENKASVPTAGQTFTRKSDPITSKMAAEDAKPNVGTLDQKILNKLNLRCSGLTTVEASMLLNIPIQCVSTRFAPLRCQGLIIDSGFQRKNPSGSWAIVWLRGDLTGAELAASKILLNDMKDTRLAPEKSKPSQEEQFINQATDIVKDLEDLRFASGDKLCYASREGIRNLIRNLEQDKHKAALVLNAGTTDDDVVLLK